MIEKIAQMRDGLRAFFTRLEAAVDDVAAKVSPVVATVTDKVEHGVLAADAWLRRLPTTL